MFNTTFSRSSVSATIAMVTPVSVLLFSPSNALANPDSNLAPSSPEVGIVQELTVGDRACYASVIDEDGEMSTQFAAFDICERNLVNQRVQFTYEAANIAAVECFAGGDTENCGSEQVNLIVETDVLAPLVTTVDGLRIRDDSTLSGSSIKGFLSKGTQVKVLKKVNALDNYLEEKTRAWVLIEAVDASGEEITGFVVEEDFANGRVYLAPQVYTVNVDGLRVRDDSTLNDSGVKGYLNQGTQVTVLRRINALDNYLEEKNRLWVVLEAVDAQGEKITGFVVEEDFINESVYLIPQV